MFTKVNKKVLITLAALILVVLFGGFFYLYWQNQADIRESNKTLPRDVKVIKSLFSNEYKVVNKIDGYEFKIPDEWNGVSEIEYIPKGTSEGYTASSMGMKGKLGQSRIFAIDCYTDFNGKPIMDWAEDYFRTFGLIGDFVQEQVGAIETAKTQENVHLLGMYVYFFEEGAKIYAITNGSEEFIREIIINGQW